MCIFIQLSFDFGIRARRHAGSCFRQVLLNFIEKALPKNVELFLFVPKESRDKFYSHRAKIVETKYSKYKSFFELRKFCKKEKIDRLFSMGALPQEGYVMAFATLFSKTDSILHLVVNPFNAFMIKFNKKNIKALEGEI